MTERQYVKVSIKAGVAILTIDHPPANALDSSTMQDLNDAFDEVLADDEVKAIVITGAGQFAFVAGADVNEIAKLETPKQAKETVLMGQAILNKIEASPKPVIAAINGFALGGGNELAMACHIRIASDRARLGQPEINLGIMPGFGGTQRLPRMIGRGKALEILLSGDPVNAQEAARLGLVDKVVPAGDVVRTAAGLGRKIASKGKLAIQAILEAVEEGSRTTLAEGLLIEAEKFAALVETEDMREGVTAFLEKRQPKFKDR
ncbi:MAG: enoyl-CoA hydratase-related protein [Anaerolineae bacterium]